MNNLRDIGADILLLLLILGTIIFIFFNISKLDIENGHIKINKEAVAIIIAIILVPIIYFIAKTILFPYIKI